MRTIEEIRKIVEEIYNSTSVPDWTRWRKKNAYYSGSIATTYGNFELFKSYTTVVGVIDIDNKVFYQCGNYSVTTCKQVIQWYNLRFSSYERILIDAL